VKIAWVILAALTLDDLITFTKSKSARKFNWRFLVLFFPLALAVLVKPTGLSSRLALQKGVSTMALTSDRSVSLPPDTMAIQTATGAKVLMHGYLPPSPAKYTIKDDSMYMQLDRLYAAPQKHKGEVITMLGFVTPDTILGKKSFFLARIMITCCAADGMPIGFYCTTNSTLGIRENDWILLTGRLETRSVKFPWNDDKKTIPLLKVITVKKTTKPQMEYVYPVVY
jgi:putative membrane protein